MSSGVGPPGTLVAQKAAPAPPYVSNQATGSSDPGAPNYNGAYGDPLLATGPGSGHQVDPWATGGGSLTPSPGRAGDLTSLGMPGPTPLDIQAFMQSLSGQGAGAGAQAAQGVAGQLAGQIAALQGQEQTGSKQIGSLYCGLANQLQQYVPAEDKSYDGTISNVGNIYNDLQSGIGSNYDQSAAQINAEMARLGQQQTAGNVDSRLLGDKSFEQGLAKLEGSGALSDLQFLKAGAHNYNQSVVGMAKTEGTNRQADLVQALQAEIAAAQSNNAKAQAAASKAAIAAGKSAGIGKAGVEGMLAALASSGGSNTEWAKAGGTALDQYMKSDEGQKQGEFDDTVKPIAKSTTTTGTTAAGSTTKSSDTTGSAASQRWIPENMASVSEQIANYLRILMPGTGNESNINNLANLIGAQYTGDKNYAG